MIRSIIVDDEQYTLEEIKDVIESFDEIDVIETTTNPLKVIDIIKERDVELAFLDIEMPGINGIALAEKMYHINPDIVVVFITAYDQYAVEAFEVNAVDYILKPIREERIAKTINKIAKIIKIEPYKTEAKLKFKLFKKFRVINNDEIIKWRTAKDGELLAYFIENVNVPIHKEKLAEEMWSKIDLKNALVCLQSSIYRVRKFLSKNGYENSIKYANNCYTLNEIDIDCDLWNFNKYLKVDYILSDSNINNYERIIEYYDGNYLEEDGYVWAISLQEELKHKYLELAKNIGKYYFNKEDFFRAIKYLEKAVKIEPLYDEAIKLLFQCYYRNNTIGGLKKQFIEVKNSVKENYGMHVSQDIVDYYKSLVTK